MMGLNQIQLCINHQAAMYQPSSSNESTQIMQVEWIFVPHSSGLYLVKCRVLRSSGTQCVDKFIYFPENWPAGVEGINLHKHVSWMIRPPRKASTGASLVDQLCIHSLLTWRKCLGVDDSAGAMVVLSNCQMNLPAIKPAIHHW